MSDIIEARRYHPPAPKPRPRPLGAIALMRTLKRNPLECWASQHFEQAVVAGGLPFGHVLLVHEPRAIRHILLENEGNYRKDRLQRRVLSAGLGDGLLSAEAEQWHRQRRLLAPLFALRSVVDFAPAMMRAAEGLIDRWAQQPETTTIDVASEMSRLTLDVLERTIFSDGFERDAEAIRVAMRTYFNTVGRIGPLDIVGAPDFIPRLSRIRVWSTMRFFEAAIDEIIAKRRRLLIEHPDRAPRDILTRLLEARDGHAASPMTEAGVRSNVLTFIAAGHETTANSLSWAVFLLSQAPDWRARVEAEVERELGEPAAAAGLAERLVETRAVVDEAMRLYPPIAAISRVALDKDEVNGQPVKPGSLIVISPYVLHRHRLLWDDPGAFDPGRFLGDARASIDRFAYLPFGAGPRTCIGSAFALQEATLVLAMVAKHFRLQPKDGHAVWPLLRVTLCPAKGLPMRVYRRMPKTSTTARGPSPSAARAKAARAQN